MRCAALACFLMSVQALVIPPKDQLIAKAIVGETFDGAVAFGKSHVVHDESKTSEQEHFIWAQFWDASPSAQLMYAASNVIVLAVIAIVYWERGPMTVAAIMALVLSLSFMSNTIQKVYHLGFKFPQFITGCHQLCSFCAAFTIILAKEGFGGQKVTYPSTTSLVKFLGPIAVCFAASLGCSNLALLHSSTHFYEMLTPMSPLVTFFIGLALGKIKSMKLLPCVLLVAVAMPLVALGDIHTSLLGLLYAFGGVCFRACKAQLQSLLLTGGDMPQNFHPLELTCWTGILTFGVMIVWSTVQEGLEPYEMIGDLGIIIALGVSCANATILNLSVMFVMKELGPVAQQILGELKGTLACVGAVAAFGEVITLQQMFGYGIAIIGVFLYNRTDMQVREEERQEAKDAAYTQQFKKAEEA